MIAEADSGSLRGIVAFTGRLASMRRREAFAVIDRHGGMPRRGVTKRANLLVVGQLGWPLLADGQPSKSLGQAQSYGIPIISEKRFLEWIGRARPDDQARTY